MHVCAWCQRADLCIWMRCQGLWHNVDFWQDCKPGRGRKEETIFQVTCLPSNAMNILDTPSQPAPRVSGDLVIEMKCQAEWVIDWQLDKLSKRFHSGFPVHTYYPITSGWHSVIFCTDHPDRGDNWANWDWNSRGTLPPRSKTAVYPIMYSFQMWQLPQRTPAPSPSPHLPLGPVSKRQRFKLQRRGRRLGQRFGNSCPHGLTNIYKYIYIYPQWEDGRKYSQAIIQHTLSYFPSWIMAASFSASSSWPR